MSSYDILRWNRRHGEGGGKWGEGRRGNRHHDPRVSDIGRGGAGDASFGAGSLEEGPIWGEEQDFRHAGFLCGQSRGGDTWQSDMRDGELGTGLWTADADLEMSRHRRGLKPWRHSVRGPPGDGDEGPASRELTFRRSGRGMPHQSRRSSLLVRGPSSH